MVGGAQAHHTDYGSLSKDERYFASSLQFRRVRLRTVYTSCGAYHIIVIYSGCAFTRSTQARIFGKSSSGKPPSWETCV